MEKVKIVVDHDKKTVKMVEAGSGREHRLGLKGSEAEIKQLKQDLDRKGLPSEVIERGGR